MAFRILLLTGWLLLGMAGAVAHFVGPGVERQKLDTVAACLRAAEARRRPVNTPRPSTSTARRSKALPEGHVAEGRAIRIERAKAQMLARQLPEAHGDLKLLVDDLSADPAADPKLLADARSALANSQYYMTWLMRLEGLGRDEWEPEVEASRQAYKLLAEDAESAARRRGEEVPGGSGILRPARPGWSCRTSRACPSPQQ